MQDKNGTIRRNVHGELHGLSRTRLYAVWRTMKDRCNNPNSEKFRIYGGRGICVCEEWMSSFTTFREWALDNGYDESAPYGECTLDRIDVNGNYEPSNCRWIDIKAQANNRRERDYTNRIEIEYQGKTYKSIAEISKAFGFPRERLENRIHRMPIEEAMEQVLANKDRKWRKELPKNPKRYPPRPLTEEEDKLVLEHKISDWELGEKIKRSEVAVRAHRCELKRRMARGDCRDDVAI